MGGGRSNRDGGREGGKGVRYKSDGIKKDKRIANDNEEIREREREGEEVLGSQRKDETRVKRK